MKILFALTPAFNPNNGGVQRTTYKLGKFFTERGISVYYYSLAKDGHVEVTFGSLLCAPHAAGCNNENNLLHLRETLLHVRPDIVINQMPYESALTRLLNKVKTDNNYLLIGCLRNSLFNFKNNARDVVKRTLPTFLFKILNNRIGIAIIQFRHWWVHRIQLRRILDKHDFFVLLAPPNRTELEHFVGRYRSEKVACIPNSIPEVSKDHPQKDKVILYVGRLNVEQKRCDLLLTFWKHACEFLPDWKFVIVGDGPHRKSMEVEVDIKGLPRVEFKGYQEPESFYRSASIFVMPSAYEGFPNVLLEAQSHGVVPVVFNSYDSISWIVNHDQDAFLVQPFNIVDMAKSVIALANNNDLLVGMRRAAKVNAERFVIDKVGEEWLHFFRKQNLLQ